MSKHLENNKSREASKLMELLGSLHWYALFLYLCLLCNFLLNLKFEASRLFCGVEFVAIGVMDWVKLFYFLVGGSAPACCE